MSEPEPPKKDETRNIAQSLLLILSALFLIGAIVTLAAWVQVVESDAHLPECAVEATNEGALKLCKSAYSMKVRQYRSDFFNWSTDHRASVFMWQRYTTVVSYILIVSIIVVGIYLAVLEFNKGRSGVTKLKFGADGVEISSEIIGLIVLTLSLAFTYFYIDRIYPVNDTAKPATEEASINTKTEGSSADD